MTKHDSMMEYFKPAVEKLAEKLLNFNFSPESEDTIGFVTNYSGRQIKKYFGGSEKEYGFSIIVVKAYSANDDDLNLEAMNFAQGFMDWLQQQDKNKNYPDFGENCKIKGMENLQNMPNLAGINYEEGLARYMLQCRVVYYEKEN